MLQQKEHTQAARPSPSSTAQSQSMLVDELLERCRQLQKQEEEEQMSYVSSFIQHESVLTESEMDAGQLTGTVHHQQEHQPSEAQPFQRPVSQNVLQSTIERVLRKNMSRIAQQTYARLMEQTTKRLQRRQHSRSRDEAVEDVVEGEVAQTLLTDIQERLSSLIKYACLSEESAWQQLDCDDVASYLVLSEVSLKSEVEKKKLMYVSNYLFDRLSQHRSRLCQLTERHEAQQRKWRNERIQLRAQVASLKEKYRTGSTSQLPDKLMLRIQQIGQKDADNQQRLTLITERFEAILRELSLSRQSLQSAQASISEQRNTSNHLKEQLARSEEALQSVTLKQTKQLNKLKQLQTNNSVLQQLLKKVTEDKEKLTDMNEQILSNSLRQQREGKNLEQQTVKQALLEQANSKLEQKSKLQKHQIQILQGTVAQKQLVSLGLQQERDDLIRKLDHLGRIVSGLEQEKLGCQHQLSLKIEELELKEREHRDSLTRKEETMASLHTEIFMCKGQLQESHKRTSIREGEFNDRESSLEHRISELVEQGKILHDELSKANEQLGEARLSIKEKSMEKQRIELLCQSQQTQLVMAQQKTTLDREEISRAINQIASLKQLNRQLQSRVTELEEEPEESEEDTGPAEASKFDSQIAELKEETMLLRRNENLLRSQLIQSKQALNIASDQLHQTQRKLEDVEAALSKSQQCVDELHTSLSAAQEKPPQSPSNSSSEGIERQVVVNFLLNIFNSELPLSSRMSTIRTMAKALRMKPDQVSSILKFSQRSFIQFSLRRQPKVASQKVGTPIHEKLYDFFQQDEDD